ncbi:OprD family outer membrane porin [Comamonas endophytica]|uniref:OprD family porin n=1 Tax=Comamonas endophytica TaxID=2949090 RepID=A0ABY6GGX9_9BURK|nr:MULTISPECIES: OprD family outer membrane porin [unclassified Acidovorax]MCD2514445.1 OprD family porin [Acidovorax sp. D4N7]UYG53734.1 OprD family porin [Acidovorax sp. 5MLIR]
MARHHFSLGASMALLGICGTALAGAQDSATGLAAGSTLQLHNRLVFEQLDYRHGSSFRATDGQRGRTQAQESGYGLMLNYQSGYTRGPIGMGVDAHAYAGLNLGTDAGGARATPRYVARDGQEIARSFGRAGAALKLRVSSTELKIGEMRTRNPIFNSSDTRLLPETNRGWLLTSTDIPALALQAGRFSAWADRNSRKNGGDLLANYSGANAESFSFAGGTWTTPVKNWSVSSYLGRYEDHWNTWYLGSLHKRDLAPGQSLAFSFNLYRNRSTGAARAGEVDNTTFSLMTSYGIGVHKVGVGYQKVDGSTPFDYVNRGSIWLDNAMQLSDFNGPREASWQLRYDVDLGAMLAPGLSAGVAYTRGSGIDHSRMNSVYASYLGYAGTGGRHWERDLLLRYAVAQGAAKGLVLQLRHGVHRVNRTQGESNIDQIRVQAEMPVQLF